MWQPPHTNAQIAEGIPSLPILQALVLLVTKDVEAAGMSHTWKPPLEVTTMPEILGV